MKIKFPKKGVITIDDLVYDHIYLVKDEVNDYGYLFYDAYSNHEYRIFKNEYIRELYILSEVEYSKMNILLLNAIQLSEWT